MGNSMQMMTYFFPIMTIFISFSLPAGLGFYWILSNIIQIAQQYVLTKYFAHKPEEEPEKEHYREREQKRRKKCCLLYTSTIQDFMDAVTLPEGGDLVSIEITQLTNAAAGTLRLGTDAVELNATINKASLDQLNFVPAKEDVYKRQGIWQRQAKSDYHGARRRYRGGLQCGKAALP